MEVYCGRKYGAYEEWDTSSYEEAGDGESFDKDRRDDAEDSFCIQLVLLYSSRYVNGFGADNFESERLIKH
ncbi:hypothetical protein OUZ56_001207 [Daphnia magna]|uniref:Uncharacterized protein n=1 Tax=Daphnia magna TaxID=35525 RepID=A0ABR0A2K4_9CRUS|nr:hypothetical protein OUZ56_001207 [Daphnia magna]